MASTNIKRQQAYQDALKYASDNRLPLENILPKMEGRRLKWHWCKKRDVHVGYYILNNKGKTILTIIFR